MSSSDPRKGQSAYQRWELASLAPTPAARNAGGQSASAAEQHAKVEQAIIEGRAAGYAAGIATAAAERARLATLISTLNESVGEHEQRLADEVLDMALVLARQLVGEALAVRREFILPVVSAALRQLPQSTQRVELRLNPADAALVRSLLESDALGARCQIVDDTSIAPGGCRIETEQCDLDVTVPSRWRRLLANLGRSDDWLEPA
jgi:flagellar assembly protein FliH